MGTSSSQILQKGRTIQQQLTERIIRKYLIFKPQIDKIQPNVKALIRKSSAIQLSNILDSRTITCRTVILTFIERVSTVGIQNGYIIDEMFQQAISQARYCDQVRLKHPQKKCWRYKDNTQGCLSPFFGVPASLKQSILYKGKTSYIGQITPSNQNPQQHPLFVQIIMNMGFIPFIRTNVPPACKLFQTINNIFGYAKNPWNIQRSCGGSSGGQSGAISSGCSPIGFGSDIGGSIRIPSEWCGLTSIKYALRSTVDGNAYFGKFSSGCSIKSQLCPIAKSVDDLILFSQFIFDMQNYKHKLNGNDVYLQQQPFYNKLFDTQKKLKIGYYKSIPTLYKCSKAHQRVLAQTIKKLQLKGHIFEQIQIPYMEEVTKAFFKSFSSDSSISYLQQLRKQEPILQQFSLIYKINLVPLFLRKFIDKIIKKKSSRLSFLFSAFIEDTVEQAIAESSYAIKHYEQQIYQYITSKQLDAWICPGFPLPAIAHGDSKNFTILLAQTIVWNCLQYPSGGVPISTVAKDQVDFEDDFNDSITRKMTESIKGGVGLPVGLQVNSLPNQDETVLYLMKQIEGMCEFRKRNVCPDMRQ